MSNGRESFDYDVFISYRWAEPDRTWVREHLVPALRGAGVRVCLDIEDFVPGRDLILEMARAGRRSRRALCVLSPDYFDGNRMVHFESLYARRFDPGGMNSVLVPLVLRPTEIPDWMQGLIPVDWVEEKGRDREWRKLLRLLEAPDNNVPPPGTSTVRARDGDEPTRPVFIHEYNLPRTFIARENERQQLTQILAEPPDGHGRPCIVAITAIGGVGKSCLCRELIEQREIAAAYSRIIWFSFYEARAEAEDHFFREVLTQGLKWKDYETPLEGTDEHVRLRRALSNALDNDRTLLVLDGVEVIQFMDNPAAANYGVIKPTWAETDKLLRHILNAQVSACLITSRVPLRNFETMRGFHALHLDVFTPNDGATLLASLGVKGRTEALKSCAETLGGHALSLVAAGRYMARRNIAAGKIAELIDNPELFRQTAEGEKVQHIVDWYRSELTQGQEYFLTRLSLHDGTVTRESYPVLVREFPESLTEADVEEQVVHPLVDRGLIDSFASSDDIVRLTAHPLMKLAFSRWLKPVERNRVHEEWARAAMSAAGPTFLVSKATSLDELHPLIRAIEHYLAAGNWREAWSIFWYQKLGIRLGELGYFEIALRLGRTFEDGRSRHSDWSAYESVALFDRIAWLLNRLDRNDEQLAYRRKELASAREGQIRELRQIEAIVAGALANSGFVNEAAAVDPMDRSARGIIALGQGRYDLAEMLLAKTFDDAKGHERTRIAQPLAEALYRAGKFDEASTVLTAALQEAVANGFNCCRVPILGKLTELAFRMNDAIGAKRWNEQLRELRRSLDLGDDAYPWILLDEGEFDAALAVADSSKVDSPASRVARHITRARVFVMQGRWAEAERELALAEEEGLKTGFGKLNNDLKALRTMTARRSVPGTGRRTSENRG